MDCLSIVAADQLLLAQLELCSKPACIQPITRYFVEMNANGVHGQAIRISQLPSHALSVPTCAKVSPPKIQSQNFKKKDKSHPPTP